MPKRRIYSDPTAFRQLEALVKPFEASGRTKSAAFLIWFLQIIYRLDETEAQDAVCDKRDDMGVDAVRVNDDSEEVVLFQAKRKETIPSTLGDSDLKSFVGALTQFRTRESIEKLIAATENAELKKLLVDNKVDAYDYKSEFKSEKQVGLIRKEVMKAYDEDKFTKRIIPFTLPR